MLIEQYEKLKPGKKAKITFLPAESKALRRAIIEWRNQLLQEGSITDPLDEVLLKLAA